VTLVCLPGGPGLPPSYLGDLGGLSDLVMFEPRPGRVEDLVDDVEALRERLGLDQFDLLGHSAGGSLACLYAARFPDRLRRLVLIAPSVSGVGLDFVGAPEALDARAGEPWYPDARAAINTLLAGDFEPGERLALRARSAPFAYGRWDAAAQAHFAAEPKRDEEAAASYYADFAPDFAAIRAGLQAVTAPVLVLVGGLDPAPSPAAGRNLADLFPNAEFVVQPGASHSPWVDDASAFVSTVSGFLTRSTT